LKARVTVYPRREILDPQGKAIRRALAGIGFTEVEDVRAGKSFEITLGVADAGRAGELLEAMCKRLLANTVVEDYAIELLDGAPAAGPAGAGGAGTEEN
jgi:phosphoribosylformylglycinamidine synthase